MKKATLFITAVLVVATTVLVAGIAVVVPSTIQNAQANHATLSLQRLEQQQELQEKVKQNQGKSTSNVNSSVT
jgi:predicted PurR-regulated permease PerM